jgi:hypothetical protein
MASPYMYYPIHHTHQADLNPGYKTLQLRKHEGAWRQRN